MLLNFLTGMKEPFFLQHHIIWIKATKQTSFISVELLNDNFLATKFSNPKMGLVIFNQQMVKWSDKNLLDKFRDFSGGISRDLGFVC